MVFILVMLLTFCIMEGMSLQIKWTQFFSQSVMILSLVGIFITLYAMYYFSKKHKATETIATF